MSTTTSLAELGRRELAGLSLVGPDDPGYDEARAVHNGMIDKRPALIARCTSADDIARTIAFARARASHDQRRVAVDHAVVHGAGLVIAGVAGTDGALRETAEVSLRGVGQGSCGTHATLLGRVGRRG